MFCEYTFYGPSTIVTGARFQHAVRVLPSPMARRLIAVENDPNGTWDEFRVLGNGSIPAGLLDGDWENGTFPIWTVCSSINKIRTVEDVLSDILPRR